jgi:hypothetical protein
LLHRRKKGFSADLVCNHSEALPSLTGTNSTR